MATARKPAERGKTKEKESEITDEQKKNREEVKKWIQKIEAAKKVKKAWQQLFRIDLAYEYRDGNSVLLIFQTANGSRSTKFIPI